MDRKQIEAGLHKMMNEQVKTWEDMYRMLERGARRAIEVPMPELAYGSIFLQQSFLQALREMPEEGNIRVLAQRTVHLLVHETGDRLGAKLMLKLESADDEGENDPVHGQDMDKAKAVYDALLSTLAASGKGKQ